MNHETLHNTIRSRFKTQVATPQSVSAQYDNAPFAKPENATWVRWSVLTGESRQRSFGASTNRYRTAGVAVAQIFSPILKGDKSILALADVVKAAFLSVTDSGVVFQTPSIAHLGVVGDEWQTNVTCPFYADDVV